MHDMFQFQVMNSSWIEHLQKQKNRISDNDMRFSKEKYIQNKSWKHDTNNKDTNMGLTK